jgi:hypothetical protein
MRYGSRFRTGHCVGLARSRNLLRCLERMGKRVGWVEHSDTHRDPSSLAAAQLILRTTAPIGAIATQLDKVVKG